MRKGTSKMPLLASMVSADYHDGVCIGDDIEVDTPGEFQRGM